MKGIVISLLHWLDFERVNTTKASIYHALEDLNFSKKDTVKIVEYAYMIWEQENFLLGTSPTKIGEEVYEKLYNYTELPKNYKEII